MKNDFDRVAPIYDLLAKIVFGDKLAKVQKEYLDHLSINSKVLIVGGGTGKILEWLPIEKRLAVTFVEMSDKMITKAKSRNSQALNTNFHLGDIMEFEGKFDYIIANFFFDCFEERTLIKVLKKLNNQLYTQGKLIVADFSINYKNRDKIINRLMHWFFKVVSNLESKELKDIRRIIIASGFCETHFKRCDRGQLFAGVYLKDIETCKKASFLT